MLIALGKLNIFTNIKLYNSSDNTNTTKDIVNIKNVFLFITFDKYIQNGIIRYINNKAERPKNNTLLKQTKALKAILNQ